MDRDPLEQPNSRESLGKVSNDPETTSRIKEYLSSPGTYEAPLTKDEAIRNAREALRKAPDVDVEWPGAKK